MYLIILFLPFLSSLASGLLGRKLGIQGSHFISLLFNFLSIFYCNLLSFQLLIIGNQVILDLFS
jgi:hypothetical protein